jgi:hypothetical protein
VTIIQAKKDCVLDIFGAATVAISGLTVTKGAVLTERAAGT